MILWKALVYLKPVWRLARQLLGVDGRDLEGRVLDLVVGNFLRLVLRRMAVQVRVGHERAGIWSVALLLRRCLRF